MTTLKVKSVSTTGADLQNVLDFSEAALALIPLRVDGSKAPAISGWKSYQQEPPTEEQLRTWFGGQHRNAGAALICGTVSGGLEVAL